MKTVYAEIAPFTTKDGSQIRELMHPAQHAAHGVRAQSFAEAIIEPGQTTALHLHRASEEIYHITQGAGRMTLGEQSFDVAVGDTVCIAPNTPHGIRCTSGKPLKILCACAPAYAHADTVLL